jgi:hypothetical protein
VSRLVQLIFGNLASPICKLPPEIDVTLVACLNIPHNLKFPENIL